MSETYKLNTDTDIQIYQTNSNTSDYNSSTNCQIKPNMKIQISYISIQTRVKYL